IWVLLMWWAFSPTFPSTSKELSKSFTQEQYIIDILIFTLYIVEMLSLNWDLTVLSRAIQYNNLSGAAQHVGISQPQLSRIVSRLESELGVPLLNRETRRHSTWTAQAHRIV